VVQLYFSNGSTLVGEETAALESLSEYEFKRWLTPSPTLPKKGTVARRKESEDEEEEERDNYVCRVEHKGRVLVIKFVGSEKMFKAEERVLKDLAGQHHVIPLLHSFKILSWKCYGLVFEHYDSHIRALTIKKNNLTKLYLAYLLEAVVYVHEKQIIHRDIKPENVGLRLDLGSVPPFFDLVLEDFGLAFYPRQDDDPLYEWNVGTIGYMAPEMMLRTGGQELSPAIDVFGIGIIFGELLRGSDELFSSSDYNHTQLSFCDLQRWPEEWYIKHNLGPDSLGDPAAYDLLCKLMAFEARDRISAKEALTHPYFHSLSITK